MPILNDAIVDAHFDNVLTSTFLPTMARLLLSLESRPGHTGGLPNGAEMADPLDLEKNFRVRNRHTQTVSTSPFGITSHSSLKQVIDGIVGQSGFDSLVTHAVATTNQP